MTNRALTEPRLTRGVTVNTLIRWLAWADPNGCWTNDDSRREGKEQMTYGEALSVIEEKLQSNYRVGQLVGIIGNPCEFYVIVEFRGIDVLLRQLDSGLAFDPTTQVCLQDIHEVAP